MFNELPDGQIEVINECNPSSAFFYIGEDIPNKKTILVEDKLSKEILEAVANSMGPEIENQLNIQFASGGSTEIKRGIAWYSKLHEQNKFVVLDGDEIMDGVGGVIPIYNTANLMVADRTSLYLSDKIATQTKITNLNFFGFNSNEPEENKIIAYLAYLDFFRNKVKFLDQRTPEEIIWDTTIVDSSMILTIEEKIQINGAANYKEKFRLYSLYSNRSDTSEEIFIVQKMFITNWLRKAGQTFTAASQIITDIVNA